MHAAFCNCNEHAYYKCTNTNGTHEITDDGVHQKPPACDLYFRTGVTFYVPALRERRSEPKGPQVFTQSKQETII